MCTGWDVPGVFYMNKVYHALCCSMTANLDPLRVTAAVLLGIITGGILFLVIAMLIGIFNDMAHMNISVTTNIAENIFSAILLAVLIIVCVAGFYRKVATTLPTEPKAED